MTVRVDINDLTTQLSLALDRNYEVIDMDAVMAIISTLEGTLITKDQLETTRLAKYINQLRRRTKNEQLARRSKTLLKKWREMLGLQQVPNDTNIGTIYKEENSKEQNNLRKYSLSDKINNIKENDCNILHNKKSNSKDPNLNFKNVLQTSSILDSKLDKYNGPFLMEQISNSSSMDGKILLNATGIALHHDPIVIDIQDSDSDSSSKSSTKPISSKKQQTEISKFSPKSVNLTVQKHHNIRNRKDNESFKICSIDSVDSYRKLNDTKNIDQNSFGNISEILGLSSSSTSNFLNGIDSENMVNLKSELSFAGKFTQNLIPSSPKKDMETDHFFSEKYEGETTPKTETAKKKLCNSPSQNSKAKTNEGINIPNEGFSNPLKMELLLPSESVVSQSIFENLDTSRSQSNIENSVSSKVPKKRGRKRGSKGVDSIIASETSISSQMLINSIGNGNKKVKTTKELYAEMQGRKTGSQKQKDVAFEPFSGNEDSNSVSNNSEKSQFSLISNRHRVYNDSSSESQFQSAYIDDTRNVCSSQIELTTLNMELIKLVEQAGPTANVRDIEETCISKEIKCTCCIINIETDLNVSLLKENIQLEDNSKTGFQEFNCVEDYKNTDMPNKKLMQIDRGNNPGGIIDKNEFVEPPLDTKLKVKSIFDLDFDEDEDPLNEIKAEVAAASLKKDLNPKTENGNHNVKQLSYDQSNDYFEESNTALSCQQPTDHQFEKVEQKQFYEVKEDPFCIAKQFYQIRTSQITQFHINTLHNFFISSINGNWDESDNLSEDRLYDLEDVVPKYTSLEGQFCKTMFSSLILNDVCYRFNGRKKEILPFLGVAPPLWLKRKEEYDSKILEKHADILTEFQSKDCNIKSTYISNIESRSTGCIVGLRFSEVNFGKKFLPSERRRSRRSNSSSNSLKSYQKSKNLNVKKKINNSECELSKSQKKQKRRFNNLLTKENQSKGFTGEYSNLLNEAELSDSNHSLQSSNSSVMGETKKKYISSFGNSAYNVENEENISPTTSCDRSQSDELFFENTSDSFHEPFTKSNSFHDNKINDKTVNKNVDEFYSSVSLGKHHQKSFDKICEVKLSSFVEENSNLKFFGDDYKFHTFPRNSIKRTLCDQLFHAEELIVTSPDGCHKEYILDIDNTNSSSDEDTTFETVESQIYPSLSRNKSNDQLYQMHLSDIDIPRQQNTFCENTKNDLKNNEANRFNDQHDSENEDNTEIPIENNGNLLSFNTIETFNGKKISPSENFETIKDPEFGVNVYRNESNDEKSETLSLPRKNFKEWQQVLQLRSYNDELLTVLPYVVLD